MKNFFDNVPLPETGSEIFETLCSLRGTAIECIRSNNVSKGAWYDQEEDEWVMLITGEAELEYEDGTVQPLKAGDHLFIPSRKKHRVLQTSADAMWLAVHIGV